MLTNQHDNGINMFLTNLQGNLPINNNICRFCLVLNGNISILINSETFNFNENDIFMTLPNKPNKILSRSKNLVILLEIDIEFLNNLIEDVNSIICNSNIDKGETYDLLRKAFAELAKSFFSQSEKAKLLLTSNLFKFLYILTDFESKLKHVNAGEKKVNDIYQNRVNEIERYIKQNYNKQISMSQLAEKLYLTPQYTSKFIKQHLGMNFISYVNLIRLNKAVKELINTNNSITQIALNHGFPNLTAFYKIFREKYHQTPMMFRNQYNSNNESNSNDKNKKIRNVSGEEQIEAVKQLDKIIIKNEIMTANFESIKEENISADVFKSKPLKIVCFEMINLGFAANIWSHDFQKQLAAAQSELNFKYARFQGIIEPDIIDKIPNTNSYNFSKANRIIDYLYTIKLIPFIEISTKPKKINVSSNEFAYFSDICSHFQSLDEWKDFLQSFINNCVNRYGIAEVEKWKFEGWLPHGSKLEYTNEGMLSFINQYEIMYKTIKSILPNVQIGGFGYNISSTENILNTVNDMLSKKGITLDFLSIVSFHTEIPKQENSISPYFTTNSEFLIQKITEFKNQWNKTDIPIVVSEWNFDFTSRNFVNDSIFKALFVTKNILENTENINTIGYWLLSDITSEYKDTNNFLFGGNGLLTVDGIKKPAYFAYQFLSKLGDKLIQKGDGYIITSYSRDTYQIILYNYQHPSDFYCLKYDTEINFNNVNDIFEDTVFKNFSIELQNISKGSYRIKTYCLNKDSGSILDNWIKMGGTRNITPSEIEYFNNITVPSQSIYYINGDNTLHIKDKLRTNEIHLITIKLEI